MRYFYPIDWPLGEVGAYEVPWAASWLDYVSSRRWKIGGEAIRIQRDGSSNQAPSPVLADGAPIKMTKVVLAAAHLNHNPAHCRQQHRNIRALCQW